MHQLPTSVRVIAFGQYIAGASCGVLSLGTLLDACGPGPGRTLTLLLLALGFALAAVVLFGLAQHLFRGRDWARLVTIGLALVAIALFIFTLGSVGSWWLTLLAVWTVYGLVRPPSSTWS